MGSIVFCVESFRSFKKIDQIRTRFTKSLNKRLFEHFGFKMVALSGKAQDG